MKTFKSRPFRRQAATAILCSLWALGLAAAARVNATAQVVSNVRATQRPGTKLVDIYYDLAGLAGNSAVVSVAVSTNGGMSYTLPATSFSGDGFGPGVLPGSGRAIVWDAGADWPGQYSANLSFRVTASGPGVPAGMAFIPAGPFPMGDLLDDFPVLWNWGWNPETPVHTVYVSAFFMQQFEVTKALWDNVHDWATNHGYRFEYEEPGANILTVQGRGPDHPAVGMNWLDAVKWCNARSENEGLTPAYYTGPEQGTAYRAGALDLQNAFVKWNAGYRLPTEAEWEKAARGGSRGHRFPWVDTETIRHSRANYVSNTNSWSYDVSPTPGYHPDGWQGDSNSWPGTTVVGHFAPNEYGLYDMAGNVSEWCWDWAPGGFGSAFPYVASPPPDPRGPDSGGSLAYGRAVRGGAWMDEALYCRAAFRAGAQQDGSGFGSGFRCVLPGSQPLSRVTAVDTRDNLLTVSGRIRSAQTGAALGGVTVNLGGQTVTTGPDGVFTLPNLNLSAGNLLSADATGFTASRQTPQILAGSAGALLPDLFLRSAEVTNRPVITDIRPQYDGIFLAGFSFPNQYTALVNWNGFTPGTVELQVDQNPATFHYPASGNEVTIPINMLSFPGSYTPGANKVIMVAVDASGLRSDPFVRLVNVIPPPAGLELSLLEKNVLYGDSLNPATLCFQTKVPPANLLGAFDMAMPLLETLGLHLEGEYKLTYETATGAWQLGPDSSFLSLRRMRAPYLNWGLWGPGFWANAWAGGLADARSGFGLDQVRVQMGIDGEACILRVHFTDWLPPGPAANQVLDAFALVGIDINQAQRIDIYGLFGLGADLTWSCREGRFSEAILTPSGGVRATYGIDLYAASLDTYAQGVLSFPIRITSPQAWRVEGQVLLGLSVYVWQVVDESWDFSLLPFNSDQPGVIASSGNWDSPSAGGSPFVVRSTAAVFPQGAILLAGDRGPRLMERDYLEAGQPRFLCGASQKASAPAALREGFRQISRAPVRGSVTREKSPGGQSHGSAPRPLGGGFLGETNQVDLTLLENVFPFARPAIASREQELMLLYVNDGGGSNNFHFTDIAWTRWDGTNWSAPLPLHTNAQAEFMPQVKYDGNGDAIAVWQRVADPSFTNLDLTALAAQMELVWSRWDHTTGTWSEPAALTANDHLDNAPLLCGPIVSGNVLLVWTENPANLLMGTNGPGADAVLWSEWSAASRNWSTPQPLVEGLAYRLSQSLAGAGATALYAWTRDGDGVLAGDADQEVFYATFTNGSWGSVIQLTTNGLSDKNVRAAMSADGESCLFWESGTNLLMNRGFSATNRLVRSDASGAGFVDYAVTLGPANNLALLWQEMSTNGPDTHYAVYDPVSDRWSRDDLLSSDAALERSLAPVWDDVGNLTVAFLKQQILYTNKLIILTNGNQLTLTNVPQRGRTDLVVTKRALIKDLALEPGDLVVAGVNYLPGDPVSLNATVRNRGNVAVSNVVVSFYDGNPATGGSWLTNSTLPGWLEAGGAGDVDATWVVSEPAAPHALYAVVNPGGLAGEFNEANNTRSVTIGGTDLAVSLVSCRPESDGAMRVIARVQNLGAPSATGSTLAIRREGQTNTPLSTVAVPSLQPGQTAQVALDLPPGTQPQGRAAYRLFADDTQVNPDANTNNSALLFVAELWLDSDGDGMPDSWESEYPFLDPHNPADAPLDYDGDGLSNLAEYLAGTAPDDPLSCFRLTSVTANETKSVAVAWSSVANKFYTVQRAPGLGATSTFTNIAEHLFATPPENFYRDLAGTNSAAFFYRVRVE